MPISERKSYTIRTSHVLEEGIHHKKDGTLLISMSERWNIYGYGGGHTSERRWNVIDVMSE